MSIEKELEIRKELYGRLIDYHKKEDGKPQPITTLLKIIVRNKIKARKLILMTFSIENKKIRKYYEKYKNLLSNFDNIHIYGYGKEKLQIDNKITFFPLNTYPVTHYNLIIDKNNKFYLYFEPYHKDINDFGFDYNKEVDKNKIRLLVPELRELNERQLQNIKEIYKFYGADSELYRIR